MKIVLIGIQGSGKSTQGNLLSDKYGLPYLSTGHIFRTMAQEAGPLARYIKETISAGVLIPDEKTIEIVREYLSRPEYAKGYIMDGFPRTVVQAESFKEDLKAVVYIKVSDDAALKRLGLRNEGREDDTAEAIKKRIEQFHILTEPVIEHYKQKGMLIEVDGERSIEEIHQDIMSKLNG